MSMSSREDALEALASLLASAYDWTTGPSRRLKLWTDVSVANRPACFIFEGGFETYSWTEGAISMRRVSLTMTVSSMLRQACR